MFYTKAIKMLFKKLSILQYKIIIKLQFNKVSVFYDVFSGKELMGAMLKNSQRKNSSLKPHQQPNFLSIQNTKDKLLRKYSEVPEWVEKHYSFSETHL